MGVPMRPLYVRDVTELDHVSTARAVYDATAVAYAQLVGTELTPAFESPIDRAVLAAFVEYVTEGTAGLVADVGCGPGRVAAFLAANGLDVVGIDLSQAMLAVARDAHPGIRFDEGQLTALPVSDQSLAGAVCWYSIIHIPPEHLHEVFAELARVLSHEGHLLVAFQAGDGECVHRADAYGTGLSLTSYRHSPDEVARQLTAARFRVLARAEREPDLPHELARQALLLARLGEHASGHVADQQPGTLAATRLRRTRGQVLLSRSSCDAYAPDERRCVRQEQPLAIDVHSEEAADHEASAVLRTALAGPAVVIEGVEPVVNGDLVAGGDGTPCEHGDAVAHGVRIAGVIEVAARRGQHREALEAQFA